MCGRYALMSTPREIEERFGALFQDQELWNEPRYNAAPSHHMPVIVIEKEKPVIRMMRWGFVPSWASEEITKNPVINARAETASAKPFFRDAMERRRCLVPANGFFEWRRDGKRKVPYFIHQADSPLFAFAGVWETRVTRVEKSSEAASRTSAGFAILTLPANKFMKPIHERMPAILSQNEEREWLLDKRLPPRWLEKLVVNGESGLLRAHETSTLVNSPQNNSAECLATIEPNPGTGT